jgi:hypothetical protein
MHGSGVGLEQFTVAPTVHTSTAIAGAPTATNVYLLYDNALLTAPIRAARQVRRTIIQITAEWEVRI